MWISWGGCGYYSAYHTRKLRKQRVGCVPCYTVCLLGKCFRQGPGRKVTVPDSSVEGPSYRDAAGKVVQLRDELLKELLASLGE